MADTSALAGVTILGCPYQSFLSFESACSLTDVPACATATPANYDAACCGSLTSYGLSVYDCFQKHAPTCIDTSAFQASLTGQYTGTATNPCAVYATPGGSSTPTAVASTTTTAAAGTGSAGTTTAPSGGSSTTGTGTSSSASASTSAIKASAAAPKVGAGLKVYIGLAAVGALAVLSL